jgi:hypothetical protein
MVERMTDNLLYYGDNLDVLRLHVKDESVDLVYLDPPFNSNANYNVLFGHADGTRATAQIKAFDDTWRWDQAAAASFQEVVLAGGPVATAMTAFQTLLGPSTMLAYLAMMAPRLTELHRVLKPTGRYIYIAIRPRAITSSCCSTLCLGREGFCRRSPGSGAAPTATPPKAGRFTGIFTIRSCSTSRARLGPGTRSTPSTTRRMWCRSTDMWSQQ